MKRYLYIFVMSLAIYACEGAPEGGEEVYTLLVDKTEIQADGQDMAAFTVLDSYGNVISTSATIGRIYYKNLTTGLTLPRLSTGFTSISNGEYEFSANVYGVQTENTVKVKVVNRRAYEYYHRNVGLFKCTSVWCPNCPTLSATLHNRDAESAAHSIVLSCHGKYEKNDPLACPFGSSDLGNVLLGRFGGSGWPTLVYDLALAESGAGVSLMELSDNIMERRVQSPATCGIKVDGSSIEDNVVTVNATMKTSRAGSYDLTCVLVADGLTYYGAYSEDNKGIYDDVVIKVTPNCLQWSSETGRQMTAEEEMQREFSFNFPADHTLPEKLDVVVYAHRKTDKGSVMDNIISVPLGETSEFVIND